MSGLRAVIARGRLVEVAVPSALGGRETAPAAADAPASAITEQVRNGVHVRMAVLYHLLAGEEVPA